MNATAPRGVYAAVATPVSEGLEPDREAFVKHCRWLLANGCDGLAPLGTTGEANSLSLPQRLGLIEAAAEAGLMDKCIVGTGAAALGDAVAVTKKAISLGAAGALLLPPFYYKNPSEDGLYAFFSELVQRVGGVLKLYLYHFPQMSSVPISLALIGKLKAAYGDIVAGLKDSSGDWNYSASVLKEFPGFGVYSGSEEFLLANLRAGGPGCISATTNFTAPLARAVFQDWKGKDAEALQASLTEVRRMVQSYPMQAATKEVLALINNDPKWRTMLPPNRPLSAEQRAEFRAKLSAFPQMRPHLPALQTN